MAVWRPVLGQPWTEEDLDSILEDALKVLAHIGIQTRHPDLRRRLAGWGSATFTDDRAFLGAQRMRALWEETRSNSEVGDNDDDAFSMGGCWAGLTYCDPESLEPRPARQEDVIQMSRLWDAHGLSGMVPVMPEIL